MDTSPYKRKKSVQLPLFSSFYKDDDYLTRIHIRSETLADQRMNRLYGVPLLDSETRGQFIAARCAMERFQTDYALRLACPTEGGAARLDLDAAWSCA